LPPEPLILGFDTSAAHCAAALLCNGKTLAQRHEEMNKGQAERLMPLLEELLAEAGARWRDITAIGVGIGPGNFTGIRISVAAARGLALALSRPAIGVSGFESLAEGQNGPVLASIDARQDRLFVQRLNSSATNAPFQTGLKNIPRALFDDAATCVGFRSEEIAAEFGAPAASPCYPPAVAIVRIAESRYTRAHPRPAPLYIRPADAAPSRNPAPVILP